MTLPKILFVADVSIDLVIGGAERVLYEQSTRLAQRGYEVHILTRHLPGHHRSHAEIDGVQEWRYPVNPGTAASFLVSTIVNGRKLFESLQRQHDFGMIIFHQPFSAFAVLRSKHSKAIRKIYVCHSFSFEEFISRSDRPKAFGTKVSHGIQRVMRKWIEKSGLVKSGHIVALSRFTLEKLVQVYRVPSSRIALIPGGVDLERFRPATRKDEIRKELQLPEKKIILFTVRNLVQRMGLENLIDAVRLMITAAPDIHLVVGGAGPLRESLEHRANLLGIQAHVRFEGFIPEESLPEYYQMADMFILPTRELEGFGLVTLEALAVGLPVLGTPVGGTREILGRFDSSFLFRDTTAEAIAEMILAKYLLIRENPAEWRAICQACRRFVEDHYSWGTHVDALEKLFQWAESAVKRASVLSLSTVL